jgi:hypothetical protein
MQSALIVIVLSISMLIGGRMLMRQHRNTRTEGAFSMVIGMGLFVGWCNYFPGDFGDLGYHVHHSLRQLSADDGAFPVTLFALMLAIFVFVLFLLFRHSTGNQVRTVKSFFGPMNPVRRRPRRLR